MEEAERQSGHPGAPNRESGARGSTVKREATSWMNWQAALYVFVLGWICLVLVPLTSLWWLVLVCGMATPIALATLDRSSPTPRRPDELSTPSETGSEDDGAPPRLGAQRLDDPLSERELEVLALMASGRTNAEIARDLFVATGTVKSHTGNIYRKLGARNRAEALGRARELKLLP
jgi:DNA-binding CsgD family transcriptional regulator